MRVKIANDYTVAWPVWRDDGPAGEDEFPIPPDVARDLRAWAAAFNEHFAWDAGWDDPTHAIRHAAEGHRLREAVQAALGPGYTVVLDLWEA